MKSVLLVLLSLVLCCAGCKKSVNEKELEGTWVEKMITTKFAGTRHRIEFNADMSFRMKLDHFSDAIQIEPCLGNRTEYVKGTYQAADGKITFTGNYCDEAYNQYIANCEGTESFEAGYTITFKGKDLVFDFEKEDPFKIWLVKQ